MTAEMFFANHAGGNLRSLVVEDGSVLRDVVLAKPYPFNPLSGPAAAYAKKTVRANPEILAVLMHHEYEGLTIAPTVTGELQSWLDRHPAPLRCDQLPSPL